MNRTAICLCILTTSAWAWQGAPPPGRLPVFRPGAKPAETKPAAKPAARPAPAKASAPSYKDLKYPPLRPIQIPAVETFTLPNGMKVYLLENHELPVVSGTARVRTGNLFDPPGKVGLASITGTVLRTGGTRSKTGDQLDEQLENIAASVESSIGETSGQVSFSALKENTDEVLAIFKDVLTQPEFRQEKIDLVKTQIRSSIARRNDSPGGIAQREFSNLVYGKDTPYGWSVEYATVDRVTREDLQAFYTRYFFPANILLAVSGDFSAAEMKSRLEKLFADWTVTQPPVPAFPKVRTGSTPGTYLAVKQDVTQTFFAIGHLGGVFRDADYPALEVMSDILGGGFRSRLVQRVRTKMGWAYSISANWGAHYDHPGLFQIAGSTKSVSTVDTIRAVQEEVSRIRATEVTEEELETAKSTALNSLVFAFDTKVKTLNRMMNYEYFGYPKDFIQQYQKALAAVTRADVLRVAKQYLRPEDMVIVAVGNPADFGQKLEVLGRPVTQLDISIPEPARERSVETAASLEQGRVLLDRMQKAVGGAAKLAAVKDMIEVVDFRLNPEAGGFQIRQTDRYVAPSHFRQDSQLPNGRISAYSDGKTGWITTPQGAGPLAGAQLKQVQGDLFRLYVRLLISDRLAGRRVNFIGNDTLEISDGNEAVRLEADAATGLPRRVTYESVHVAGPPITVTEELSDFRETGGIRMPYKITIHQGGRKFADVTVVEYKWNTGLTVEEISKRP